MTLKQKLLPILFSVLCVSAPAFAQDHLQFEQRLKQIMARPEFAHSRFGVAIYSMDQNKVLYERNSQQLFTPGSTTKLFTEGTALELLGADYRFHTRIYRTGLIEKDGTLNGDLVLVASGDPNLSNRIQPDGTLAFENEDHSYGGTDSKGVGGDPLTVIHEFASKIAEKGIKNVKGRILIDTTLFPEGDKELGTGVVISPIVVNDNIIDVIAAPGPTEGAPITIKTSPQTAYVTFVNQATTGKTDSKPTYDYGSDTTNPDGSHVVTVTGSLPLGTPAAMVSYRIPQPGRFAAFVLTEALKQKGISVSVQPASDAPTPDFKALATNYKPENLVAEHISPPLKEEVKVTLKVSQNLHASMTPFILGATLTHAEKEIDQAGFDAENAFLKKAGLDLASAAQSDGAGGNAFYTPDLVVRYLLYMSRQKDYADFYRALPILGKDGTLFKIQVSSPAAGHVHAKTGTYSVYDALNKNLMVTGKGLAGYMDTAKGEHLIIALYTNMAAVPVDDPEATQKIVGEALGEIASAAYDSTPDGAPTNVSGVALTGAASDYDVIIRNGKLIDGSGGPWAWGDVAIRGDRIVAIGKLDSAHAKKEIDAKGFVVSPGFIDMLGQSEIALLIDNRSLSKLSQGITSEITGEGGSIAPQNEKTLAEMKPFLEHYKLSADWTTLDQYFNRLQKQGTPLNIGTYVGAAQIREAVLGEVDRAPNAQELDQMRALVEQAMKDGALGISTALIYPPGHYAKTPELIELAKVAAKYGGLYATHMRSEGASEMQAIDEAIKIGRDAGLPVEIFHLKISGKPRWGTMPQVAAKIQAARDSGLDIRVDQYPYIAGGTALASALPPWVAEGGTKKLLERLHDPAIRERIKKELATDHSDWENLIFDCGGGAGVMIAGVENDALKKYDGKTVAEMAKGEGKPELDALFDFIIADEARTGALYFMANEADLVYGLKQPWSSIGLDASEQSLDGPLFEPHNHPRAFGSMPRFLGHYVRDQKLLPLEEAIRKITSMPAQREHLVDRGLLRTGFFADITIFDPDKIIDRATYDEPNNLSEGVHYVFVNGQLEFDNGKLTGINAGRPLRGQGFRQPEVVH